MSPEGGSVPAKLGSIVDGVALQDAAVGRLGEGGRSEKAQERPGRRASNRHVDGS